MNKLLSLLLLTGFVAESTVITAIEVANNQQPDEKSVDEFLDKAKEGLANLLYNESERSFGNIRDQQHYIDLVTPAITQILALPVSKSLSGKRKEKILHIMMVGQMCYILVQAYPALTQEQYKKIIPTQERLLEIIINKYCDETIDAAQNAREIIAILDDLVKKFYREKTSCAERTAMAVWFSESQRNNYPDAFSDVMSSDECLNDNANRMLHNALNGGKNRWARIPGSNKFVRISDEEFDANW